MGMLWRFQGPVCAAISFDPAKFVRALKLPGGTPEAVRQRFPDAFQRGDALTSDWMKDGADEKFCREVANFFDGRHDFYGNVKAMRDPPVPGLTLRN